MTRQYKITRLFLEGIFKGMTHTGVYYSPMEVGFTCMKPIGGSPYKIIECIELSPSDEC